MPVIFGLLVIVAVVLVIGWLQDNKERQRVTRVRNEAGRLGFEFLEEEEPSRLAEAGPFLLFFQGVSSTARNVMLADRWTSDEDAPRVAMFEYTFNVPYGRYVQSWRQTVIRLTSLSLSLPAFSVMPIPVFEALAAKATDKSVREQVLGTASLTFDAHPQFAEQSHVYGPNRTRVRPLFTEALIAFFESHPDLCVEAVDSTLILYHFDNLAPADEISTFLDTAHELHSLLKEALQ